MAKWRNLKSILPDRATPIWARSYRKSARCILPAAAIPISRPVTKPIFTSRDRATSICTPIPGSWKPTSQDLAAFTTSPAAAELGDIIMAHKLVIIAVIGLSAAAVCMGAAAAIGGKEFGNGLDAFSVFDGRPRSQAG